MHVVHLEVLIAILFNIPSSRREGYMCVYVVCVCMYNYEVECTCVSFICEGTLSWFTIICLLLKVVP